MARLNVVKNYRGKRTCQHRDLIPCTGSTWTDQPCSGADCRTCSGSGQVPAERCGIAKSVHADELHDYDPGALRCSKCSLAIEVGDPYKFVKTRSPGMRSGVKRIRCAACPAWKASELTGSPHRAVIYRIQEDFGPSVDGDTVEEIRSSCEAVFADFEGYIDEAEEVVEALRESAANIVDGFGHETSSSYELEERADNLENQIEEARAIDSEPEEGEDAEEQFALAEEWADELVNALGELDCG